MRKFWLILCFLGTMGLAGQITTFGTGEMSLIPDQVHFMIGIRTDHDDASRALSQVNARAQVIIEGFRQLGVQDEQIQTQGLNVYPTQEYEDGQVVRRYYIAEHRLRITLSDLSLIGQGFDIVTRENGKNTVSIQLDSSQRKAAEEQALADAVLTARKHAAIMAETEGLTIGNILHMTNTFGATPTLSYDNRSTDSPGTTVMPGQIIVTASATVIYEIATDEEPPD